MAIFTLLKHYFLYYRKLAIKARKKAFCLMVFVIIPGVGHAGLSINTWTLCWVKCPSNHSNHSFHTFPLDILQTHRSLLIRLMSAAFCYHIITSWGSTGFLSINCVSPAETSYYSSHLHCAGWWFRKNVHNELIKVQNENMGGSCKAEVRRRAKFVTVCTETHVFLCILLCGNKAFIVDETWQRYATSVHLQAFWH